MDNVLYIVSNINMATVKLVADCLSKRYPEGFKRIVIFESRESEQFEHEQTQIFRLYFGNFEKTSIILNSDGSIPSEQLYSVFDIKGNKVIDLSNGPKVTTSALYMAASLCRVKDVYCLILHAKPSDEMSEGKDYEYLKLQQIQGFEKLAKLSYFDLIYYTEDINGLISAVDRTRSIALKIIYDGMMQGISGFFTSSLDARGVINNITLGVESIISTILVYLRKNKIALDFCKGNDVDLNRQGDPVGIMSRFFKKYVEFGRDMNLVCLCTVPGLLSGLRDYRNISAHYSKNYVNLTDDNARTVINMQIEVLKCLHLNTELWRTL